MTRRSPRAREDLQASPNFTFAYNGLNAIGLVMQKAAPFSLLLSRHRFAVNYYSIMVDNILRSSMTSWSIIYRLAPGIILGFASPMKRKHLHCLKWLIEETSWSHTL